MTSTGKKTFHQQHHHFESLGDVQYRYVANDHTTQASQLMNYGQTGTLDGFQPPSQQDDSYEVQQHHTQQHRLTTDIGDEDKNSTDSQNESQQYYEQGIKMQPQYHGKSSHLGNNRGNNNDLESISKSKALLLDTSEQQRQDKSDAHSDLQKAQLVMQRAARTQSSFEGYQTDLTNTSNPPTTVDNSTLEHRTIQTVKTPLIQAAAPAIEYTEVFVWGEYKSGQLGIDSQLQTPQSTANGLVNYRRPDFISVPRSCSFNILIKQVSCGQHHSAILTAQGHLYMMGSNSSGQLGVPTVGPSSPTQGMPPAQIEQLYCAGSPVLVESLKGLIVEQVSCGADFTAVITRRAAASSEARAGGQVKSEIYAWGNNESGQLGNNEGSLINNPLRLDAFDVLDEEVIQVACGGSHTLFLTSERDVISCGNNFYGQCGFDPDECSSTNTPFKVAAFDGIIITQVTAGFEHSLYLSEDGQVFASGSNIDLCLGVGDSFEKTSTPVQVETLSDQRIVKVNASFNSSCITDNGELFIWGRGIWGDSPFPVKIMTISNRVIDVSLGKNVNVAVDEQGLAWSWGQNTHGELGVGDNEPRAHPYPILNLKGKIVTKAHCGHNFSICLGSNVRKEMLNQFQSNSEKTGTQFASQEVPNDLRKKKTVKKKKNIEAKKGKSIIRPQTNLLPKFVNETNLPIPQQKKSRQQAEIRNPTFGGSNLNGNSRSSSVERSTSAGAHAMRRQQKTQNSTNSQERTLANLQQKYGAGAQMMQITTMAQHEKSRDLVLVSPINKPSQEGYESGKQNVSEAELMKTIKLLKSQVKKFTEENKALKQELFGRATTIDKLEKSLVKLQNDDSFQKQLNELSNDIKRRDMKLRKMKERRNIYRAEKDALKLKVVDMQKDNEALFVQVAQMQDQSHSTRAENAKLKTQLQMAEKELEVVQADLKEVKEHTMSIRNKNDQVESELQTKLRWQDSQLNDVKNQLKFEENQKKKMANEIKRLENLIQSREDYMVSLENESITLRREIKEAKFNNEKSGYTGFVSGLTKLRQSRERSTSNNRGTASQSGEHSELNVFSKNSSRRPVKQEKEYDDLPQKDFNHERKTFNYSRYQEPVNQLSASSKDARSRLNSAGRQKLVDTKRTMNSLKSVSVSPNNESTRRRTTLNDFKEDSQINVQRQQQKQFVQAITPMERPQVSIVNILTTDKKGSNVENQTRKQVFYHEEPIMEPSVTENTLAVVHLEDFRHQEAANDEIFDAVQYQGSTIEFTHEALQDNSMVLQQQNSDQPTKLKTGALMELQPTSILSSDFKDQHRKADLQNEQQHPQTKKMSTMIPLGAPKSDSDLTAKYKQMLMAKLDIKTIQKRRRPGDKSQE